MREEPTMNDKSRPESRLDRGNTPTLALSRWPCVKQRGDQAEVVLAPPELQDAWAQLLGDLQWDFFVTLTFDPKRVFPVGRARAQAEATAWCNTVAASVRRPVGWLVALERGRSGLWHAHVLLIGAPGNIGAAAAMWHARNGRIDVQRVTAAAGAVLYSSKEAYRTGEIYLSDTIGRYVVPAKGPSHVALYPRSEEAPEQAISGSECLDGTEATS